MPVSPGGPVTEAEVRAFLSRFHPEIIAAVEAPQLGELGAARAILRPVPNTRAKWEFIAAYEASDPPRW